MLAVPRSQHALQSLHSLPCSLAGQLLPSVTTVLVQGQKPAAGLSILCPDNLERRNRELGIILSDMNDLKYRMQGVERMHNGNHPTVREQRNGEKE